MKGPPMPKTFPPSPPAAPLAAQETAPPAAPPSVKTQGRSWRGTLFLGGALFAGLAYLLHSQQAEILSTSRLEAQPDSGGKLRPLAGGIDTPRARKPGAGAGNWTA